ncbi:beta-lactamase [Fusarium oxysporum f. sp. lycopersici 4287]|uniref:Beta-lactamase n=2 Tax=Fusarium oxysporum TaxID=5507 RepID=A0A0J9W696_FUSO4|nr:beta-lactamase [Fusarium oxysporum f. sp. lycopersici 4287]EXK25812.1 beta-lactamase [Fusarium oxysporum f. sp. melonis 26406]KNB18236.1 beta-lactamase [Fusarium oxysporum f. sp. lycopersici 4287]
MAAHDKTYEGLVKGKKAKSKDIVHNLRNLPLTTEPWVKYSYTNLMYTTISHVIKIITGKWLRDVLKELIWVPLDMDSTLFDLQDASHAPNQLASGYYWDIKEGKYGEVPFINVTQLSGAGAIFSNVLDFAKWVKCLLHEAAPFFKEVHRDIKSSRMIEPTQLDEPSDMVTYGLGWHHSLFKGHVIYTHSGGVHIYGAQVYWLPSIRYGVVAFANTVLTSNAVEEILTWNLIQDRLKIPENERSDVKSKSDTPSTVLRNVY